MRAQEFITEAFDSSVDYTVVRASNELFTTKASIGGRDIIFNAQSNDESMDSEPNIVWEVVFYEKRPGNMTYGKSGSGGEMQVFSFVLDSLKELAARYSPETIRFSAHKEDGNRSTLYQRMIAKVAPKAGYKLSDVETGGADDIFVLTSITENFADGKKKGKSRPGRVKRAGASCNGSVTDLRARAKKASGERAKMLHWCANMKSGRKK